MVKIYLDAGHEGTTSVLDTGAVLDPGAVGNGLKEADLTLAIVKRIKNLLQQYENVQLKLSREGNRKISLSERAKEANNWKADLFLSVHINAGGGTGFESYIYNGNVGQATIAYQNTIHPEIVKSTGFTDRGKKRANFAVLRETTMAAILTENGFIDNKNDADKLKQSSFLDKIAQGHVNGIVKAFGLKKKAQPKPSTTPKPTSKNGWVKENSKWYFYQNGKKQTGWMKDKSKWYYLNKDGSMATGWVKDKDKWYYLGPDGAMVTGLIQYKGKWYYLKKNGEMLSDTTVHIDKDGAIHFE